jgi:hypothetical protein
VASEERFPGVLEKSPRQPARHSACGYCLRSIQRGDQRAIIMKLGIRQTIASVAIFSAILVALVSVDERVHDRFSQLMSGANGMSSWTDRAGELAKALLTAAKYQSIDNAPLLIFAVVGAVLVVFMVKT